LINHLPARIAVLLLVMSLHVAAQAIIIRHDRNYASYRGEEARYAAVFYLERQENRRVCAATLIDPRWAITAAHCVLETGLRDTLMRSMRFTVSIAGAEREVVSVILHPDYRPGEHDEVDLALLDFGVPMPFPVPLKMNRMDDEAGQIADLVGWGYFGLGTTGRQYSDGQFRRAQNRIERADQRLLIRFDDPRSVPQVALDLEGMPGLGDSGGPALLAGAGGWLLAGVAVGELNAPQFREETQGSYGAEAVYERISKHLEWIERTIQANAITASE